MVTITLRSDLDRFAATLDDLGRRQVRFAAARALNDVTRGAVADWRRDLPSIFDRPVPFTLNAAYAIPVKDKRDLTAAVALREWAPKGTPASKYLAPEIEGGPRNLKRFERRLAFSALVARPMQTLPARGALLDAAGNMSRGQIGQMLQHLRAFGDTGQNVSAAKLRRLEKRGMLTGTAVGRSKFFVATSKQDGRPLGVWTVLGSGHVQPVLLFAKTPPAYQPRLPFDRFFEASYRRRFPPALAARFEEALRTALAGKGAPL